MDKSEKMHYWDKLHKVKLVRKSTEDEEAIE